MDAITKTREQELLEEFKEGLAADAAAAMALKVETLEQELATVKTDLAAAKKDAKAARATVTRGEKPTKPRKLGPMGGDDLDRDKLKEALDSSEKVEIAFSDGKTEVAGIPPVSVQGNVWVDHARGLMLRDPIEIEGPAIGEASFGIEGYALLIDGKQIAYTERSDTLNVAGGQKISLRDDIFF